MKKITIILAALVLSFNGYSQLDSSINILNTKRGNEWFKKSGISGSQIDGYKIRVFNGDTLVRASGSMLRAEELEVYANGSNMSSALQSAFNYPNAKWISFGSDSSRGYIFNSAINAHGRTLEFKNGNKLSGTATIDSLTILASDYDQIFDTTLTFTNLKSVKGYITPQQFGARSNGTADDRAILQKVLNIASANGLRVALPAGKMYVAEGQISVPANTHIVGNNDFQLKLQKGAQFRSVGGASNITISGLVVDVVSGSTNTDTFVFGDTATQSNNITIDKLKVTAHFLNNTVLDIRNINNLTITNFNIDSSGNKSIEITKCKNVVISDGTTTNSGRSGIALWWGNENVVIQNCFGTNNAQNLNLNDGVFDIYGNNPGEAINKNVTIQNCTASVEGGTFGSNNNHQPFRFQGVDGLKFINNTAISNSAYLLYMVRFSSRDLNNPTKNIYANGNTIIVRGTRYDRLVSVQAVKDVKMTNTTFIVDSAASTTAQYPAAFFFSNSGSGAAYDTINTVDLSGTKFYANGKNIKFIGHNTPIKNLVLDGSELYGQTQEIYTSGSTSEINSFRWIGGVYNSTSNLAINNNIRNAVVMGIEGRKSNNNTLYSVQSGHTGTILFLHNTINGLEAPNRPLLGRSAVYTESASFSVPDTADLVVKNRYDSTGNRVILPDLSNKYNYQRTVIVKNIGTSRTKINRVFAGDLDSLKSGEIGYWRAYDTAWRYVGGTSGTSGTISIPGFAYLKNLGKSVSDSIGTLVNDTTVGLKGVRVSALNNKVSVTKSGGDSANIYTVGVNEANFAGIPQSAVTNLVDSIAALRSDIGSGGGGSGTVNPGLSGRIGYYPADGTTIDDNPYLWYDPAAYTIRNYSRFRVSGRTYLDSVLFVRGPSTGMGLSQLSGAFGVRLEAGKDAVSGTNEISSALTFMANRWDGSASEANQWSMDVMPGTAQNDSYFRLRRGVSSYTDQLKMYWDGRMELPMLPRSSTAWTMYYDSTTKQVSYAPAPAGGGGSLPTKTAKYLLTGTGSAGYDTSGVRFDDGVVKMTKDRNEIRMYNTADETTNYEYGSIRYQTLGGIPGLVFESNKGGTGTTGWLTWRINGVYKLSIDNNNTTFYTSFLMGTDNSYDFGRLSASPYRIRSVYIGTSVQSGSAANTTILARYHAGPATTGLAQLYFEDKTATPSSLSDGMLWRDGSALNYRIGGSTVNLLAGGGSGNLKTRVVDDANYTIADTVNAVIIRSASTGRTMTYPSASANVGREITIWNETDFQHFASTTVIYDSSFASAYIEPNTWVRAKSTWYPATGSYAWHAVAQGETSYRAAGNGTYTATADSLTDLNSNGTINLNWERKGDKVRVWGAFNVTTTNNSEGQASLNISLPIPSTFATIFDCTGVAVARTILWSSPLSGAVYNNLYTNDAKITIAKATGSSDLVTVNVNFDYIIR